MGLPIIGLANVLILSILMVICIGRFQNCSNQHRPWKTHISRPPNCETKEVTITYFIFCYYVMEYKKSVMWTEFKVRIAYYFISYKFWYFLRIVKVTWHTATYLEFVFCIYPSKCTHTAVNTNTHTHTWSSGQPLMGAAFILWRPGSSWGFGALLKGTSSWYWRWRECCTFTPPTDNPCWTETWTHNLSIMSPTLYQLATTSLLQQKSQFWNKKS